jgi:hypothetical protein
MTFAQLAWEINGQPQRNGLSDAQRHAIRSASLPAVALIFPVPSKCDPDGAAFCNKAIPFPVHPADPESPGMLLLRLEESVLPTDRRATPLFADEHGAPFVGADMDRALRDALLRYNPTVAATRSWHSYRIRLASKLRAASSPSGTPLYGDAVIQALLRWKTPASIQTYARYDSATILKSLLQQTMSTSLLSNTPHCLN